MIQKKILIVEDEVVFGIDLMEKLEKLGYSTGPGVIRYGEDIMEAAQNLKPDLILMDIHLKGKMNGIQAAILLQEKLNIPVIFLTAFSDMETIKNAKKIGPYAFLKKPIRFEDLKITLEISLYKAMLEKQLKEKEMRFRTVADFTYAWETWIGQDNQYKYISPSCERISGYKREQFFKDPSLLFTIVDNQDKEDYQKNVSQQTSSPDDISSFEFRIICADGCTKWIEHKSQPVFLEDGQHNGRRASYRDISDRKKLEWSLEKKILELQDALDNIKTLSGFIPICASCKKIRDDKGYWNQLELYIENHSGASFSHSMCPDCMEKCYGGEDWYEKK